MYNAINRFPLCLGAGLLLLSALGSAACDSDARRQKAACDSMVDLSRTLIADKRYIEAFEVMDSIDARFPQQVDARLEVSRMRTDAMIDFSQQQLIYTDSLSSVLQTSLDALTPKMQRVAADDGDIAGYYVAKAVYDPKFVASTAIQGRVDDEDLSFYLVAVNANKPIGINALEFQTAAGPMLSAVIDPGSERAGDIDAYGIDLATFVPSDIADIMAEIDARPAAVTAVTLIGKKGERVAVPLTRAQVDALLDTWRFGDVISRYQKARWLHDKYERQLVIARDHSVNY